MLQQRRERTYSDRFYRAVLTSWRTDPYRTYLLRLLYAALLAGVLSLVLNDRAHLGDAPPLFWVVALGTVAYLVPGAGQWLLVALVAASVASSSLALAVLIAGAALLSAVFAREELDVDVPVRFALLVATVLAAMNNLALIPLAVAVVLFARGAWWDAFLQAVVVVGYLTATGTALAWTGIPPFSPSLTHIGGPVATGDWWNHLGAAWDGVLKPWARLIMLEPIDYLKLVGLWTFAGLVGGRTLEVCESRSLRLAVACVAPIIAVLGMPVLLGAKPEPMLVFNAVAAGFVASLVGSLVRGDVVSEEEAEPEVEPSFAGPAAGAIRPAKWTDIAGYDDVKREMREVLEPLVNPYLHERLVSAGIEPTRGILLYGPPGTGKTLLARAAASELGLGFVLVAGPEVLNKYVGESEAGIRRAFEEARDAAPSILFFDDIEALVPHRSGSGEGLAGVHRTLVATFLGLMDGARAMGQVVVMAATNAPDQIDAALLRPGRFDRLIYVQPPDPETRRLILERHLEGKPGATPVDIDELVKPTERFTGADLAGLVRRAYEATRGESISTEQLLELVKATRPTVTYAMLDHYRALEERFRRTSQAMTPMEAAPRPKLQWDDVGGLEDAKQALREAVMLPLEHPELITKFGVKPSRGILLYGPPGTGKTLLARVVADQARATFLAVGGSELSGYGGPDAIRKLFARALEAAPAVVFVDEIDAIGRRGLIALGGTAIHQLLVEMDGVKPAEGIVVMAATNRPQDLDEALLRPGRFDFRVEIGLPDIRARRSIFRIHLRGKPGADKVDVGRLAGLTEGYSPAEIAAAVNAAARQIAMKAAKSGESSAQELVITTESIVGELRGGAEVG